MSVELKKALISILIGTLTAFFAAVIQALTAYLQNMPIEPLAVLVAVGRYLTYRA